MDKANKYAQFPQENMKHSKGTYDYSYPKAKEKPKRHTPTPEELEEILRIEDELWNS